MVAGIEAMVRLREMIRDDVPAAHALSREQKWPHREDDWTFFLGVGEGLVAECDGQVIGTTMAWRFGANAATIGMVIVSPAVQGRGVGRQLMDAMLERMAGRTVMLNATDEGLSLYRKLGFESCGTVFQHQGAAFAVPIPELLPDERVRPMSASDTQLVPALYSRATGMDRNALFAELRKNAQGVVLARNDLPAGLALFRRFGRGYSVGPTIAPDLNGAKALISHWLGSNAGMFCRLDLVERSGLSAWLDDLGLPCVGRVTTMTRGPALPEDETAHLISLASQALG